MYSESTTLRLIEEYTQHRGDEISRIYYGSFTGTVYASYPGNGIIWKYSGMGVTGREAVCTVQDANYIIYRMADVMLTRAGALTHIGGSINWIGALSIINQIRRRSELDPQNEVSADNINETTEEVLLKMLLDERDMELAIEDKHRYDLLRYDK